METADVKTLPATRPKRGTRRPRLSVSQLLPAREVGEIDTSWKEGRSLYPKRSSQVGERHQVSFLPRAGTVGTEKEADDEPKYDVVWNRETAATKGVLNFIEDNVPANKKEKALQLIHDNNYTISNTKEFLDQIDQSGISNWTSKDKERYHLEVFRCRKNFKAMHESMGDKKMGDIIAYYLGHYKKSDDYRLLKAVRVQERMEKAMQANHNVDQCAICGEGGNLLICDGCESEWHMECTKPALKTVPEGHWECDVCVDRKFLEVRKRIFQITKSNMGVRDSRKRKSPEHSDIHSEGTKQLDAGLTDIQINAVEALKEFSRNIDTILKKESTESKRDEAKIGN